MYRAIVILNALVCLALFPLLLVSSGTYVETYGVTADAGADFLGRRASPMFLGLAVMLWLARDAAPSALRNALCYGLAITWIGIAATGLFEYARGIASMNIAVAAVLELGLAALMLAATRR